MLWTLILLQVFSHGRVASRDLHWTYIGLPVTLKRITGAQTVLRGQKIKLQPARLLSPALQFELNTRWLSPQKALMLSLGPHGQDHWSHDYPECGGQAQSPIDIQTESVQHDPALPPIEPQGYRNPGRGAFTLLNNGHAVEMTLPPSMFLRGLPHTYTAVQLHFHWGSKGQASGSEHRVNGEVFPVELHVVHFNSERYANISEAKQWPDGLAVLGILFEVSNEANPSYNHILDQLKNIQYAGQNVSIPSFDVQALLPKQLGHYFRYNGSLTTPPCFQNVLWTIFHQRVQISAPQLEKLQGGLYCTKPKNTSPIPLVNNYRAPQLLNERVVFSSCPVGPSAYSAGEIIAIVFGTLLGCLSLFLACYFAVKRIREKRMHEPKDVVFKSSSSRAVSGHRPRP
ncbi:carbonic anhydrase 14 isoform X2 [Carettochelys insculpta]|uniref:carbonic anhydrase 14 isoform X2 n=1 Tax=Carettochelys insculpta TaxID=44489 RepID=UPI003EB8C7F7